MKKIALKTAATLVALIPVTVKAEVAEIPPVPIPGEDAIVIILDNVADWLTNIFFSVAVIMIIWGAFLYLTAAGSDDRVGKAKKTLLYAVLAIIVALVSGGVSLFISDLLRS